MVGEIVEAIEDDCWWEAAVEEVKGKSATLKFRVSDEVKRMAISKLPRLTATRHVRLPRATVTCGRR